MPFTPKSKRVRIGECEITVYSIRWLAELMGVTSIHIRKMERDRNFPPPVLALLGGTRYYLPDELMKYSLLYREKKPNGNGGYVKTGFYDEIWKTHSGLKHKANHAPAELLAQLPNEANVKNYFAKTG